MEQPEPESLAGKIAIVTGAGSGVGRAVAMMLGEAGAIPALVGRTAATLDETAATIRAVGGRALVAPADVTDEADVAAMTERVARELGGIDILVLAAGIGRYGPVASYALADWNATLATNLTAPFLCARAAIPHLRARGGGSIVAISSGAGKQGYPNLAAYAASKFGLHGLLQSLAAELGPEGIKVSAVVPGSILTSFGGRSVDEKRAAMTADPGKKYLTPEDGAAAVLTILRQPPHVWTQEMNVWPY